MTNSEAVNMLMNNQYYERGYKQGVSDVLDKVRAEIETKYGQCDICEYFEDYDYEENDISEYRSIGNIADILQIIDKYKAESTDMQTSLSIGMNPREINNAIPTNDFSS